MIDYDRRDLSICQRQKDFAPLVFSYIAQPVFCITTRLAEHRTYLVQYFQYVKSSNIIITVRLG